MSARYFGTFSTAEHRLVYFKGPEGNFNKDAEAAKKGATEGMVGKKRIASEASKRIEQADERSGGLKKFVEGIKKLPSSNIAPKAPSKTAKPGKEEYVVPEEEVMPVGDTNISNSATAIAGASATGGNVESNIQANPTIVNNNVINTAPDAAPGLSEEDDLSLLSEVQDQYKLNLADFRPNVDFANPWQPTAIFRGTLVQFKTRNMVWANEFLRTQGSRWRLEEGISKATGPMARNLKEKISFTQIAKDKKKSDYIFKCYKDFAKDKTTQDSRVNTIVKANEGLVKVGITDRHFEYKVGFEMPFMVAGEYKKNPGPDFIARGERRDAKGAYIPPAADSAGEDMIASSK